MPRRRRFGILAALVGLVLVVVVGGATGIFPFRQLLAMERSVELMESQLEALREENRHLDQQIQALQTPEEVERLAREHFGLVMPGEIGYVAVAVGDEEEAGPPEPSGFEETPPWWRSLWDFLTGRDLVGDE